MSASISPSVAVLIAAYNNQDSVGNAVRSALSQSETTEVCVVDDGSSDATLANAITAANGDPRFIALTMSENAGPAAARNRAIAATTAPWLTVLDADDFLLEGRFARLFELAGDADFIADALIRTPIGNTEIEPLKKYIGQGPAPFLLSFGDFVNGNLSKPSAGLDLGFVKPLMRRSFLDAHGIRYADMRLGEDYELYARALAHSARFIATAQQGYVSVDRPGSLSNKHSALDLKRLRDCDDALLEIRAFTVSERAALAAHRNSVDCRLQWRLLIEAVKSRDAGAALATFHTPQAARYLSAKLLEQVWLRSSAALRHLTRSEPARASHGEAGRP